MTDRYDVIAGAGSLQSTSSRAVRFPHRWTSEGVSVEADFTGAHLLHLAAAGCVLNDVYREASRLGLQLDGVRVVAAGSYDAETWRSEGIEYSVEVDSAASVAELTTLLATVDTVAEIPCAIRSGATVTRIS